VSGRSESDRVTSSAVIQRGGLQIEKHILHLSARKEKCVSGYAHSGYNAPFSASQDRPGSFSTSIVVIID